MSKKIRVAINGFGRIGRASFRILMERDDVEVVAINGLSDVKVYAHLLKYDSAYGVYERDVKAEEAGAITAHAGEMSQEQTLAGDHGDPDYLIIDDMHRVRSLAIKDPAELPWKDLQIDVVLECTGVFVKDGAAYAHIKAGARRVVISAPAKGEGDVMTFLRGVNDDQYDGQEVISNASCTTNCVSPVARVMQEQFGIIKASLTTIHAVTANQSLVDSTPPKRHADLRRGRAAMINIVPTTTGAAQATAQVMPELDNKFDGIAVRVPVITGSLSDFTFLVGKQVTVDEVNAAFDAAKNEAQFKGVLDAVHEPLVSTDIIKSPYSAIVDLSMTKVIDGDMVKVIAWYDNEWGYSNRLVEMAVQAAD